MHPIELYFFNFFFRKSIPSNPLAIKLNTSDSRHDRQRKRDVLQYLLIISSTLMFEHGFLAEFIYQHMIGTF